MKTSRWFTRNYLLSQLRVASAVTLMSAAAAMAFVAGGDTLVTIGNRSSSFLQDRLATAKIAGERDEVLRSAHTVPGEGPIGGYEAYKSAARTYPANVIPPSMVQNAKKTFDKIATQSAKQAGPNSNNHWQSYGPIQTSVQPGVLSFSGATNATASRDTALVIAPTCVPGNCRLWVGSAGGGVWRTDDALAADPSWTWLTGVLALNSVGALAADPNDASGNTLYVGTGEGNRCSSGCESGVGIYKTTDGGNSWTKLPDACVSNTTYNCANSGDAFLGRGINQIVVDPTNPAHIFVGSALAVRGLSHVIGNGGTTRLEPGANEPGLYESTDGGATFTEVWNGTKPDPAPNFQFGITDVGLDPLNPSVVYASAFDAGLWRRDAGASQTLPCAPPVAATHAFPQTYTGWQCLTSKTAGDAYFATTAFCTQQCWYDQDVYTPAGMPDTVYVIGSNLYGEQPCDTNGVGCGNGISNGREVLYSDTAGDPDGAATGAANLRTFTDLSYDATINHPSW